MPLLGKAVVAIWNDILPEGRENFIEWHNREHIRERVAIPGFLRGRRYVSEYGNPEYFTLYEAADQTVLIGAAYIARLNSPTPWTRQSTADFRNTIRGICKTEYTSGSGDGGVLLTLRFDTDSDQRDMLEKLIITQLQSITGLSGISGVSLCIADTSASDIETTERKGRQIAVPNWIIMIEGSSVGSVDAAVTHLEGIFSVGSKTTPIEKGLYRLEFSIADFPTDN